ncbi:hypothetical protein V6N13_147153 [Hibiscus sabdariffa]
MVRSNFVGHILGGQGYNLYQLPKPIAKHRSSFDLAILTLQLGENPVQDEHMEQVDQTSITLHRHLTRVLKFHKKAEKF